MKYDSIADIVHIAQKEQTTIGKITMTEQAQAKEITEAEIFEIMSNSLDVMIESVKEGLDKDKRSASGLTGGDAFKMKVAVDEGKNVCGKIFGEAMVKALAVSETNACMGKIV
ncbi:MAG: L-serine ammonia-lyase, iron-sulfur-dependent, subunit alpha, partial [Anaerotignaceae bacterium]